MNTYRILIYAVVVLFALAFYRGFKDAISDISSKSKRKRHKSPRDTEWWHSHHLHGRVEITDKDTGESLGSISNRDLKFLIDRFENRAWRIMIFILMKKPSRCFSACLMIKRKSRVRS